VCSVFKMPPFLIGFGTLPSGMKVSDLNELYYSGCLQGMIESIENLLSQDLGDDVTAEFDLHSLIRMDASSQMQILADGVKASVLTINEARANRDLPPVDGGDTPYMQQQNYSLSALSKRDAQSNPFDTRQSV
ncbi:TPA: phage portal protein, partial [Neisseria gonorrhoeae]